jgi:hypothetical protein
MDVRGYSDESMTSLFMNSFALGFELTAKAAASCRTPRRFGAAGMLFNLKACSTPYRG